MRFNWIIILLFPLVLFNCGQPTDPVEDNEDIGFGSFATFEVMTWNLQNFPANGSTTVQYVARVILDLKLDLVGFQEIIEAGYFHDIADELNDLDTDGNWIGYVADPGSGYQELAYLINTEEVDVIIEPYEIYPNEWSAFPREPYVVKVRHSGEDFVIINNHLKCCGDGILDTSDDWDEENRRRLACDLLEDYIKYNLDGENVIIIGDLNDILTDNQANNVFWNFISQPDEYKFADMNIAEGSSSYFSGPKWDSHIDHILITDELFDEFTGDESEVSTIKVDDDLDGGWTEYETNISDHRPVAWRFTP